MRFIGVFWIALIVTTTCFSQSDILFDTLRPQNNFYGSAQSLDSLLSNTRSTFANLGLQEGIFMEPMQFFSPFGTFVQKTRVEEKKPVFTALPFLGFNYSFGTQGVQHMVLSYSQSFRRKWLCNAQFLSNRANGFVRNSAWKNRNLRLDFAHSNVRFRSHLGYEHTMDYRQFSGGVLNDTLLDFIGLNLVPVRKDSCVSTVTSYVFTWKNHFNLLRDSIRFLGLCHRSTFENFSREFIEKDTLLGLYPSVYFDSVLTNDRLEQTTVKNAVGFGTRANRWQAEVMLNLDYWKYRMRGNQRDTLEVGLSAALNYKSSKTRAMLAAKTNLVGAFNASELKASFDHHFDAALRFSAFMELGLQTPEVIQRFYFGNTFQQSMMYVNLQRVGILRLIAEGELYGLGYQLGINGLLTDKVYQFNGTLWDHESATSSQQLIDISVRVAKSWKGFSVKPQMNYILQKVNVLPNMGIGTGLEYQGFISKSKNLYFFAKLKYLFFSGYRPMALLPQLSLLNLSVSNAAASNYHSINSLVGFKVKTFQFHLAADNLGSFLMSKRQELLVDLPIPSWQLKLGITWVFWN